MDRGGFATSVARFMLFIEEDGRALRRTRFTYLVGLAHLGLGHISRAAHAFKEVLAVDPNHLGAQEELRRLPMGK